jgi:hypothetical protein
MGLSIRTDREPHGGGEHAVYTLETDVTVIEVLAAEGQARAA